MAKYLDKTGLSHLWELIGESYISGLSISGKTITYTKGDGTTGTLTTQDTNTTYSTATTSAAGLMSASDKTKLNGIATGAEVNQNAFSNVTVGSTTVAADSTTDTLTLVAGSNVTLTPDSTNDKITIAATNTTYSAATTSAAGLMSASDKSTLDTLSDDVYSRLTNIGVSSGSDSIQIYGIITSSDDTNQGKSAITFPMASSSKAGSITSSEYSSLSTLITEYSYATAVLSNDAHFLNSIWFNLPDDSGATHAIDISSTSEPSLPGAKGFYFDPELFTLSYDSSRAVSYSKGSNYVDTIKIEMNDATSTTRGVMSATDKATVDTVADSIENSTLVSKFNADQIDGFDASGLLQTFSKSSSTLSNTLTLKIGGTTKTLSLAAASSSAAGLMTASTQTFGGAKTFSGALKASSTLAVTGATTLSSTLTVTGASTLSGELTSPKNNFITNSNEVRFIPASYSSSILFNYKANDGTSATVNYYGFCNGSGGYAPVSASAFNQTSSSDDRLKDRQEMEGSYIDRLLSLGEVFEYKYNDVAHAREDQQYDTDTHTGLSWQTVKDVLPTAVGTDGAGYGYINYISPDYINLITGALKEAIAEIEKLKEEIAALKGE